MSRPDDTPRIDRIAARLLPYAFAALLLASAARLIEVGVL